MGEADYLSVCDNLTLADGTVWPIPITCSLDAATADPISEGDKVALRDDAGRLLGYLTVSQKYRQDKRKQATTVFGTEDVAHPGVKALMDSGLAAGGHDLPRVVLDWRLLAKLKSTYTDALIEEINPKTGRIHTSYSMTRRQDASRPRQRPHPSHRRQHWALDRWRGRMGRGEAWWEGRTRMEEAPPLTGAPFTTSQA